MSDTLIVIVLVVGVTAVLLFLGVSLVVIVRLRRVVKTQFEALDEALSAVRASHAPDQPGHRKHDDHP